MKFNQWDLGQRRAGEIVEVTLSGSSANVRLMDSANFQHYKNGRKHQYYGGLPNRSPMHLKIPRSGHWYVTVDMAGLRGTSRASVRMSPSALPPFRAPSLSSVPSLVRELPAPLEAPGGIFDVFISYASEDKEEVARPLARALKEQGLDVWFDEFELRIGASLRQTIDHGIARSRFGVVVLSRSFFRKGWPAYELDGLVTRAVSGEQVLLPIWHEVTKQEVMEFSASLADKLGRSTATHTISEIASEIAEVISSSRA